MVEENTPYDVFSEQAAQDIYGSLEYATEALEKALKVQSSLETLAQDSKFMNEQQTKLLNVAVEKLQQDYGIPNAALESSDDEEPQEQSSEAIGRLKRTIDFLYAAVRRIVQMIIQHFQQHRGQARSFNERAKNLIGRADVIDQSGEKPTIVDRGMINALCIGGVLPKNIHSVFDDLTASYEASKKFSGLEEMIALINVAKAGDPDKVTDKSEVLWVKLRDSMTAMLDPVSDPANHFLFGEKRRDHEFYASKAYFGDIHLSGEISTSVGAFGGFFHKVGMRRNPDAVIKIEALHALDAQTVRLLCRSVVRLSESVIRSSRDEAMLYKAMREANYLLGKKPDQLSLHVLRNFQSIAQNLHLNYLRLSMNAAKHLLAYCEKSVQKYEKQNDPTAV